MIKQIFNQVKTKLILKTLKKCEIAKTLFSCFFPPGKKALFVTREKSVYLFPRSCNGPLGVKIHCLSGFRPRPKVFLPSFSTAALGKKHTVFSPRDEITILNRREKTLKKCPLTKTICFFPWEKIRWGICFFPAVFSRREKTN